MKFIDLINTIRSSANVHNPMFSIPLYPAYLLVFIIEKILSFLNIKTQITAARVKKLATETKYEANELKSLGFSDNKGLKSDLEAMINWIKKENK